MSVELDPPELGFRRPFTHEVTQILRLRNTNKEPVAFKVKTTAPKQYCVRPNSGRIEAGKDVEIQVLLQAMKEDPPPDARCRDKFLVQSVPISPDQEMPNVASIWQNIEKTAKASIQERKIRVSFLPARDDAAYTANSISTPQHHNVNGTSSEEAPPAYVSPSPTFGSPAPGATSSSYDRAAGPPATTSNTSNTFLAPTEKSTYTSTSTNQQQEQPQSMLSAATTTVADTASSASAALQSQLDAAKETIMNLKKQLEEQGLKQRKSDAVTQDSRDRISTGTTGMGVHSQQADGVPVQIVAALCLLSFLLAYFFF